MDTWRPQLYLCNTYGHVYTALILAWQRQQFDGTRATIAVAFTRNFYGRPFLERLSTVPWIDVVELDVWDVVRRIERMTVARRVLLNQFVGTLYPRVDPSVRRLPSLEDHDLRLFNDFHYVARWALRRAPRPVTMVEDGFNNYVSVPRRLRYRLSELIGIYPNFGRHPRVDRILVQQPEQLPADVKAKGAMLPLRELLDRMPQQEKDLLVDVFLGERRPTFDWESVLVLTQPLFDFRRVDHDRHVAIYGTIVEYLRGLGARVYVKPHPSDSVRYEGLFTDVEILPRDFPIEVLNDRPDVRIREAVGINTVSVHNIRFAERTVNLVPIDRRMGVDDEEDDALLRYGLAKLEDERFGGAEPPDAGRFRGSPEELASG